MQRTLYNDYVTVLEMAGGKRGYLRHLKRNFIIYTGPCELGESGTPPRSISATLGNPDEMLCESNAAWGGDLEMNGVLCYKDRRHVTDTFLKAFTEDGEEAFFYESELIASCIASYYSATRDTPIKAVYDKMLASAGFYAEAEALWRSWLGSPEYREWCEQNPAPQP